MIKYFVHENIACGQITIKKIRLPKLSRASENLVLYTTSYNAKYVSSLNNSQKFDKLQKRDSIIKIFNRLLY